MSKLRFQVVSCSSEEADYPAEELNTHGPNTKGWQSLKHCAYPQEIVLEILNGEARLSQIQLLSHQSKISSKIEIYIGVGPNFEAATYKRLGYLSLDPNEKSNYQARELKTVYIDNTGQYIKFVIHKNFMNTTNYFGQVGIVAVNLIGTELRGDGPQKKAFPSSINNPINDLSLDMNLDPQTTAKLRNLSEAKSRAVAAEDYVTAKKIKSVENDLKDLGTRLAQLEIAKRKAVENEDYDRAKDLKDECDAMREEIEVKISAIKIPGVTDIRPSNRPPVIDRKASNRRADVDYDALGAGSSASESKDNYVSPAKPRKSSAVPVESNDEDSMYADDFESGDRPIRPKAQLVYNDIDPDAGNNQGSVHEVSFPKGQHPLEGIDKFLDLPTPEELYGKSKEIADQGISALIGEYRARCLFSKVWTLRAAALNKTISMLHEFESDPGMTNSFPALMAIVRVGVEDKMQQVFLDAQILLEDLLAACKREKLSRAIVGPSVDPIIVNLIEKLADTNARIKEGAKRGIELLLQSPNVVGPTFVSPHALKSLNSKQQSNWRVIVARLRLLTDIITDFGLGANVGLTADSAMTFCKNLGGFAHGNGEVRDAAKDLTKCIQKLVGTASIESYIADLRPKQMEEYFAAFGEIPPDPSSAKAPAGPKKSDSTVKSTSPKAKTSQPSTNASPSPAPSKSGNQPPSNKGGQPTSTGAAKEHAPAPVDAAQNFTVCMFCGASDKKWNEDALDLHFWKSCPLLTPCPACAQVVEIAGLPEHLLDECEHKDDYVPCETTGLAIKKADFPAWQNSKYCRAPPDNCIYCPLCLSSVEDSDETWKQHLTRGCPKNSRTQA